MHQLVSSQAFQIICVSRVFGEDNAQRPPLQSGNHDLRVPTCHQLTAGSVIIS